jgi:hypothetical protein
MMVGLDQVQLAMPPGDERLARRLEKAGVPLTPDSALPGVSCFYAADPFGNRLEFIQAS